MKKILTIIAIVALFISCDESKETIDTLSFPTDSFVSFSDTSISVLESNTEIIDVVLNLSTSKDAATSPTTVSYTITSENAIEGVHYNILDGKTSFDLPAGIFSDSLQIQPIDNSDEDGDKVITITLTDAPVGLGFPGPDGIGQTINLTLQDDDCAFSLESLGAAAWSGADNATGSEGPNASLIQTSFDGTDLLIEGLSYGWLTNTGYWDEVVVVSNKVIVELDLITGAINIPLQELCETTWVGDAQPPYSIEATGIYTSCSETMVLNYNLYQNGAILRSYTETITKN
ncbi:hypothetical protein [Polaribacter sp. Asnod1-A03]|uniref:hypothetical protein n=1 Tax=Polaribacter sp. Asnod1-A03 TaxID=3160581 RepID=UPI00386F73F2